MQQLVGGLSIRKPLMAQAEGLLQWLYQNKRKKVSVQVSLPM